MKALVVRLDSSGVVLLADPAVRAVAAHSAHVTMLCGPRGGGAAHLLPGIEEVLVWEAPGEGFAPPDASVDDVEALPGRLRAGAFDAGPHPPGGMPAEPPWCDTPGENRCVRRGAGAQ
ncbi:hypothetical protein [Streptomyces sp. NPDC054783]